MTLSFFARSFDETIFIFARLVCIYYKRGKLNLLNNRVEVSMNRDALHRAERILTAYFSEDLPAELQEKILCWYVYKRSYEGEELEKDAVLREIWDRQVDFDPHPVIDDAMRRELAELKAILNLPSVSAPAKQSILRNRGSSRMHKPLKYTLWAAAIFIPLLLFFTVPHDFWQRDSSQYSNQVLSAPTQEQKLTLPDGSTVWLKAGSLLTYDLPFREQREVHLQGEAFFQVTRDESYPFAVSTRHLRVEVLGTEFDVKALEEDSISEVTLITGEVGVRVGEHYLCLKEKERLLYDVRTGKIERSMLSVGKSVDWREENLQYEYASLEDVLRGVESRYYIPVIRDSSALNGPVVTLKLTGKETLEETLNYLSLITGAFTYTIHDDRVMIHTK